MKRLIDCAMKRTPCDVVVRGARILNVFTGELQTGDLAIVDGKFVGISERFEGRKIIQAEGMVAIPGLIDAHIHVESSMLSPEAFASLAVPCGSTGIVADPHELTNVCGIEGAEYVAEAFRRIYTENGNQPLDVYLQLPSCVPATPFETSGASLDGKETAAELARPLFHGLGEMMNFPAVIGGESDCLQKLEGAKCVGKIIDGHAPSVTGDALNAYAGAGILTNHEALSAEECVKQAACGMYVQLRNGSSAKNIKENYQAITPFNFRRFLLCSDDKNAYDLKHSGHIDDALRILVSLGVPAEQAVCMATLNVAECYRLQGKGAIAPGYDADLVLVDNLENFRALYVVKGGEVVADRGRACFFTEKRYIPDAVKSTVRIAPVSEESFRIFPQTGRMRVIQIEPYGLYTAEKIVSVERDGDDVKLEGTDLLKLAVVERHFASGNIGLALLKGYGLRGGAIGITVAHDSHNLVVLGDNNADMVRVVRLLERAGGGMAVVRGAQEEVFSLDIAGLMSSASVDEVIARTKELTAAARSMGVKECYEPFMSMAFCSLLVIPRLKLSDRGLFDLDKFSFVDLDV